MMPPATTAQATLDAALSAAIDRTESVIAQARETVAAGRPPIDLTPLDEAVSRLVDAIDTLAPAQGAAIAGRIRGLREQLDDLGDDLDRRHASTRENQQSATERAAVAAYGRRPRQD